MDKNNIDLICNIAELSGLFERKTNLAGFLQDVVEMVAIHMSADVCSIYLYDEPTDKLVLRATRGLSLDTIGKIQLNSGEGLVGQVLQTLRPMMESNAERNPMYRYFPESREEEYKAFLAVPIRRGLTRIGVMVLQDTTEGYFTAQDLKALRAIASQLATTLENAELLMELHGDRRKKKRTQQHAGFYRGKAISPGVAKGNVYWFDDEHTIDLDEIKPSGKSLEEFRTALTKAQDQLEEIQIQMEESLSDLGSLIFSSHLLMLKDGDFSGKMEKLIEEGNDPAYAIASVVQQYVDLFGESPSPRLQEKAHDVKDLGHRLLTNLGGEESSKGNYKGQIIMSANLLPSDLVKVVAQQAEGIVLGGSSASAHIAILARSLGIPAVVCSEPRIFNVPDGTFLITDANQGTIFLNPDGAIASRYENIGSGRQAAIDPESIPAESYTEDNTQVQVFANINLISDVSRADAHKCEGVGLYRSEFPFVVRSSFPSEEEQFKVYKRIMDIMGDREVSLRTLDIGGDKSLTYLPENKETNPFLGLRGIRFSLANQDIFTEQLRAILRAGYKKNLRIIFPMVSDYEDFMAAKALMKECIKGLKAEGVEHNSTPKIGTMIELPSIIDSIPDLVHECDFFSVGTNDLSMYLLAADRTNEKVAEKSKPYHPSVIKNMYRIMNMLPQGFDISVCGDAASDERLLPYFLGLGITKLSVEPAKAPMVKQAIQKINAQKSKEIMKELLTCRTIKEAERVLQI